VNQPIVIFDIEATCDVNFPKNKREIIEIGAIKIVNGKVVDQFQRFVKPKRNSKITKYCVDLTHIQQSDIDAADSPKKVLGDFAEWSKNSIMAAWGPFDEDILKRESTKNKVVINRNLFINLKKVFMSVKRLPMETSLIDS
jgi:inhibitor of KinA sporulation pathway (predicted exonuclease)